MSASRPSFLPIQKAEHFFRVISVYSHCVDADNKMLLERLKNNFLVYLKSQLHPSAVNPHVSQARTAHFLASCLDLEKKINGDSFVNSVLLEKLKKQYQKADEEIKLDPVFFTFIRETIEAAMKAKQATHLELDKSSDGEAIEEGLAFLTRIEDEAVQISHFVHQQAAENKTLVSLGVKELKKAFLKKDLAKAVYKGFSGLESVSLEEMIRRSLLALTIMEEIPQECRAYQGLNFKQAIEKILINLGRLIYDNIHQRTAYHLEDDLICINLVKDCLRDLKSRAINEALYQEPEFDNLIQYIEASLSYFLEKTTAKLLERLAYSTTMICEVMNRPLTQVSHKKAISFIIGNIERNKKDLMRLGFSIEQAKLYLLDTEDFLVEKLEQKLAGLSKDLLLMNAPVLHFYQLIVEIKAVHERYNKALLEVANGPFFEPASENGSLCPVAIPPEIGVFHEGRCEIALGIINNHLLSNIENLLILVEAQLARKLYRDGQYEDYHLPNSSDRAQPGAISLFQRAIEKSLNLARYIVNADQQLADLNFCLARTFFADANAKASCGNDEAASFSYGKAEHILQELVLLKESEKYKNLAEKLSPKKAACEARLSEKRAQEARSLVGSSRAVHSLFRLQPANTSSASSSSPRSILPPPPRGPVARTSLSVLFTDLTLPASILRNLNASQRAENKPSSPKK